MILIANLVHWLIQLFSLVVIAQTILSYFMSPYHPVKRFLDRLVDPFLKPIRRVVPPVSMLDFSPVILIILLQLLDYLIQSLLLWVN